MTSHIAESTGQKDEQMDRLAMQTPNGRKRFCRVLEFRPARYRPDDQAALMGRATSYYQYISPTADLSSSIQQGLEAPCFRTSQVLSLLKFPLLDDEDCDNTLETCIQDRREAARRRTKSKNRRRLAYKSMVPPVVTPIAEEWTDDFTPSKVRVNLRKLFDDASGDVL